MSSFDREKDPVNLLKGVEGGTVASWYCGGTAGILPEERKRATFSHDEMTILIDGSKEVTMKRRWIYETNTADELDDAVLGDSRKYDLERETAVGLAASNFMRIHKKHFDRMYVPKEWEIPLMQNATISGGYPGYGLFLTTVMGQSDDEQTGWWLWRTLTCQITGCYAQTELGHGSNVRGLETTATFDPHGKNFVLHTPTLTSMKFWPSSMVTATHAVVYAQLIVKGKHYGVHIFMVQLRDENLKPLPGIEVGDVGTKMGELSIDIGYLRLNQVRVPLRCLMAKRQYVTEDGEYVRRGVKDESNSATTTKKKKKKDKMAYLTMMGARVALAGGAAGALSKACTIAIRYAAVRKQGFKDQTETSEVSILDYKFTAYRLLKQLSFALANKFACNRLTEIMGDFRTMVAGSVGGEQDSNLNISELHATTAGLKGLCCERTALGIEDCRKACGGAAYLLTSGIAALEQDYKWRATAEGDTVVMLLETSKYLLKQVQKARRGGEITGLASCLAELGHDGASAPVSVPDKPARAEGWLDLNFLLSLFRSRTIAAVSAAESAYASLVSEGVDEREAFTECTLQMMRAGECHVVFFLLDCFKTTVEAKAQSHPECQRVLALLAAVFALGEVLDGVSWAGLLSGKDEIMAQRAVGIACTRLRPEVVALVDCFEYPDAVLNSTIGRKDGNVYEAQYAAAVKSPLNKKAVPEFLSKIKPFLDLEYLAMRDGEEGAANVTMRPKL